MNTHGKNSEQQRMEVPPPSEAYEKKKFGNLTYISSIGGLEESIVDI